MVETVMFPGGSVIFPIVRMVIICRIDGGFSAAISDFPAER
jgi:hypothetical protein